MTNKVEVYKGDNNEIEINLVDEDNNPIFITGATAKYIVSKDISSEVLIEKTTENGGIQITDTSTESKIKITLDPLDTNINAGLYFHELSLIDVDDKHYTIFSEKGLIIIPTKVVE